MKEHLLLIIMLQCYQASLAFGHKKVKKEMEYEKTQENTGIEKRDTNECENIKEVCSLCLRIPGCSWCNEKNYEHGRCDKEENHMKLGCPRNYTINPKQNVTVVEEPFAITSQISPKKVSLTARVGEPVSFTVNVRPVKNYPVDLYFLMDLSGTMHDDLDNLKSLAGNISTKLRELTNKRRLAFGSFVDKVVPPFVRQELINRTRNPNEVPPYNFRHVLDFTEYDELFKETIHKQNNSRSKDNPEATLDALMQVAACENELGWNPANTTRRIVLIATDAPFHMAGEGKFGGIVHPNDAKCHLSELRKGAREYSGLQQDYPTVNQVHQRLRASRIQPIFAVSQIARKVYKTIAKSWKDLGATYEELNEDSNNIIELIEKSYKEIISTVHITSQPQENVYVNINANCGKNIKSSDDTCQGVGFGETVSFNVTVTAKSCQTTSSSFKLLAAAFGDVEVDVDIVCSCECEDEKEDNSAYCSGHGDLTCGRCSCSNGWSGRKCECQSSEHNLRGVQKCRRTNTSDIVCEGNGECVCNECKCNLVENTEQSYYGRYCQCSDFNCDEYHGELCGGETRGKCNCGTCECKRGYIGSNCGTIDCSIEKLRCLDSERVICSNHGRCECGKCRCDPFYEGVLCQSCPTCVDKCDDFKHCVSCEVFGHHSTNSTKCDDCPPIKLLDSLDELKRLGYPVNCEDQDAESCNYYFTYGKSGEDNVTTVFVVSKKDCPEDPDLLVILLAVMSTIVGIGIILLILWKLFTTMVDRNEYQKFKRDRARSTWHREKNPLYLPPTYTVHNPIFTGRRPKRHNHHQQLLSQM